ncbi:hypothetical protein ACA910_019261 [Epithemia clementina (nom. ined.)]
MGCNTSKDVFPRRPVTGVGGTERMISRAKRVNDKKTSDSSRSTRSLGSKGSRKEVQEPPKDPPKLDESGHLLPEEVVKRSTSSITSKRLTLGTPEHPILVEYAHWTQRGFYPDDPHKENQDEFSITAQFAGGESDAMFAVFDGHGKKGHDCARFVKKKLPGTVAKEIRQARVNKYKAALKKENISLKGAKLFDPPQWPTLNADEYKTCCTKAFLETNKNLHKSEVEDNISGTTAITVSFHETLMTVCNVGDSRAVLGHQVDFQVNGHRTSRGPEESKEEIGTEEKKDGNGERKVFPKPGSLLAIPLSRDQTPYRKDERERVKLKGAAIMSIDQIEGREEMHENWGDMVLGEDVDIHGDPPRVWVQGKDYPGTAFTRSIGDSMAESIGVTAEPEILARTLTSNDHLLVIASDGIFEFLTNQEVIDICVKCENPIIACEKLVKEAYNKWLLYENRTDDITVIVCFLTVAMKPDGQEGTTEDLVKLAQSMYGNKPVRKTRGAHDNLSSTAGPGTGAGSISPAGQKANILNELDFSISKNPGKKAEPDPAIQ